MSDSGGEGRTGPRPSPRNKRAEIVAVATEYFGETGYEDTQLGGRGDRQSGSGPTALYHYFESKQQCLFEILGEAIEDACAEFRPLTEGDFAVSFPALVRGSFERATARSAALASWSPSRAWSVTPRAAPREEDARLRAFSLVKQYEAGWRDFLTAGWPPARSRRSTPTCSPAP